MPPALQIALRFLTSRKRPMLMSLAGIIFGVGFFIVTQAQTSGFETFFIKTILGCNGALRIEDKIEGFSGTSPHIARNFVARAVEVQKVRAHRAKLILEVWGRIVLKYIRVRTSRIRTKLVPNFVLFRRFRAYAARSRRLHAICGRDKYRRGAYGVEGRWKQEFA